MLNRPLFPTLALLFALSACSDGASTVPTTGGAGTTNAGGGDNAPPAGVFAIPQEKLAEMKEAIKVQGTITVKDYESGLLQIDATLPVEGSSEPPQGVPPITVGRYKTPGPFVLYLPPNTKAVNLSLILDLKGDGPGAEDPKSIFEKNPLQITGQEVTGVELKVEKGAASLPPDPPGGTGTGSSQPAGPSVDALSATRGAGTGAGGTGSGTAAPASAPPGSSPAAPGAAPGAAPASGAPGAPAGAASGAAGSAPAAAPGTPPAAPAVNPVKPVPASSSAPGQKTAIDVLDEALDGAPKTAPAPPKQ